MIECIYDIVVPAWDEIKQKYETVVCETCTEKGQMTSHCSRPIEYVYIDGKIKWVIVDYQRSGHVATE